MLAMSTTMTLEYRQALEALEVVQRHAFALKNHNGKDVLEQLSHDDPPPDDIEYEDTPSEDELKSDIQSKSSAQLPVCPLAGTCKVIRRLATCFSHFCCLCFMPCWHSACL